MLDNCEHVIDTAAEVADDLLQRCPRLRLLATSREGLRIGGEAIWPVPPLALDDATSLFVARAAAAGARLELTADLAATISEICARLDGLPLAIELAAARVRAFPPHQILSRLNDRFRLLTGGSRTALPRQQTLQAVVDWSYDLLFDDEQRVFTRLSVFPGGCDLATAQAVCADDELDAFEVADVIQALVDKSLVNAAAGVTDVRFTQLQTLAQYGREKLAERGEAGPIRDAMAACFATSVRPVGRGLHRRAAGAVADRDRPGAGQPPCRARVGGRQRRRRDGVDDRRWRQLGALVGRHGGRGQALARRGLRLCRRGQRHHAGPGADGTGPDQLPARRHRRASTPTSKRRSPCSADTTTRPRWPSPTRSTPRWRRRGATSTRPAAADASRAELLRVVARRPVRRRRSGLLVSEARRARRRPRRRRALLPGRRRRVRPCRPADDAGDVPRDGRRLRRSRRRSRGRDRRVGPGGRAQRHARPGRVQRRPARSARVGPCSTSATRRGPRSPTSGRSISPAPSTTARWCSSRSAVWPSLRRADDRDDDAVAAAVEALELHLAGGPRRLANRVDPRADVLTAAAACCTVLGVHRRRRRHAPSRPPSCSGRPPTSAPRPTFLRRRRSWPTTSLAPSTRPRRSSVVTGSPPPFGAARTVNWALTWPSRG